MNLQLTVVNRGQVIRRLSDNRDDLVIMSMVPQDMGLEFLPFLNNPIVAVAPPDHPLCHMGPLRLQDLEPYTLLLRETWLRDATGLRRVFQGEARALQPDPGGLVSRSPA